MEGAPFGDLQAAAEASPEGLSSSEARTEAAQRVPLLKREILSEETAARVKAEFFEATKEELLEGARERKHKSGKKSKKKHKKKRRHSPTGEEGGASPATGLQEEDETLGGFIERDPEAAIHEDPEDIVPVDGGIDSDVRFNEDRCFSHA